MSTITDVKGREYVNVGTLGVGGQGKVWKVQATDDGTFYAFKAYKHNKNGIRKNIEKLAEESEKGGIKDKNGNTLMFIVPPLTMVELKGDSFGYIMELVDLKNYVTLLNASSGGKYPSCRAICRIIQNFATVFETLHLSHGMCYKDVNEGNIYFNPDTGDLKIIDNDNVGYSDNYTITGTSGYMAPEVILGSKPNHNSDRFSFAVFVYRLLVGGRPFEGPYTRKYCEDNDILPDDAADVIFGTDPVFVWHPSDKRNSILHDTFETSVKQVKLWNNLPESIKELFINVFVTNLSPDMCANRASSEDWKKVFKTLEENLVQCPSCGKFTFGGVERCFECSARLKPHTHEAVIEVLSLGETKKIITVHSGDIISGCDLSRHIAPGNCFRVGYSKKADQIAVQNVSGYSWSLRHPDKTKEKFGDHESRPLEAGMAVIIAPKKVQINVLSVS